MPPEVDLRSNRLLALLPATEFERLVPELTRLDGHRNDTIYRAGGPFDYAYFPLTAVMSLIATDTAGRGVEMSTVGCEGLVGLPGALAGAGMIGEVVQQIDGKYARIALPALRAEIDRHGELSTIVDRYAVALLSQIGQGAVCLRYHPMERRAARWLLATRDRVGHDDFLLTQGFLAIMLAATRPQVSVAAASLKRAGLIDYSRGHVRIIDRGGLEAASCECYAVIRSEFERLLGDTNGLPWEAFGG